MRYLEIRRHSIREPMGSELTQAGRELAARVGRERPPFARGLVSPLSRARDTALAMGLSEEQLVQSPLLVPPGRNVMREAGWAMSFGEYGRAVFAGEASRAFAADLIGLFIRELERIGEGESLLAVSHSGTVEIASVACLPSAGHEAWGPGCSFLEGVRFSFDGRDFVRGEPLRAS